MIDLLSELSGTQVVIFSIMLILAIKGGWEIVDYFKNKYKEKFDKDFKLKKKEEEIQDLSEKWNSRYSKLMEQNEVLVEKMDELSNSVHIKFEELDERMDQLYTNDKHSIKQAIVKDYHYFVDQKGWIDDFSLDALMLLFEDYKALGGNSYVASLMDELKKLPRKDPRAE